MNEQVHNTIVEHIQPEHRAGYDTAYANVQRMERELLPFQEQAAALPSDREELMALGRDYEAAYYRWAQASITWVYWCCVMLNVVREQLEQAVEEHLEPNISDLEATHRLRQMHSKGEMTREKFMQQSRVLSQRVRVRIDDVKDQRKLLGRIRVMLKGCEAYKPPGAAVPKNLANVRMTQTSPVVLLKTVHDMASASAARVWDDIIGPKLLELPE